MLDRQSELTVVSWKEPALKPFIRHYGILVDCQHGSGGFRLDVPVSNPKEMPSEVN